MSCAMKSFRLSTATRERLRWLGALTGMKTTDLVERAVGDFWERETAETRARIVQNETGGFAVDVGKSGRWIPVGKVRGEHINPPEYLPVGEMAALLLLLEARGAEVEISEPGFSKVTLALDR